jgi:hypothetical protein
VSGRLVLFANLGAEEGEGWRRMAAHPSVREAARLWRCLFPAQEPLAGAFARDGERAALDVFAGASGLVPWLVTREAASLAAGEGIALFGPPAELVARVHDKAFALERARALGLLPPELADCAFALGPEELADADTVRCRIERAVARWPAALARRFVLKPRLGTSGRGRLAGREGGIDGDALRGALGRLRERGGCVVEPWLERTVDLSAQLFAVGPEDVRVLGTFAQVLTPQGVPVAHRARVGPDGAAVSGSAWDGELRAAALAVARAAAAEGYTGACGVDAFAFRGADGRERFRAVVELNARFTTGTSAAGWVARAVRAGLAAPGAELQLGAVPPPFPAERSALFAVPGASALFVARAR